MTQQIPIPIAKDSKVPIIVGITGHRWIMPEGHDGIQQIFNELFDSYPNTPIVVLSPLADGADRLIARIAVNNREKGKDVSLICPLPMSADEYSNDFNDPKFPNSKDEFYEYLKDKCDAWFDLPLVDDNTPANIAAGYKNEITGKADPGPRNEQYKQVGIYVAQYSHILIGLWDGQTVENTGGTYQILKLRNEGKLKKNRNLLDEIDGGPIYHFPTTRIDKNSSAEIGEKREIFPGMDPDPTTETDDTAQGDKKEKFHRVLRGLESYNTDIEAKIVELKKTIDENPWPLLFPKEVEGLPDFSRRILHYFNIADALAIHYQTIFNRALKALFVIVIIALAFLEVYAHKKIDMPFLLLGYPVILGVGWTVFWLAKRSDIQNKYLDYRALAEGLRVQLFWVLSGRCDEVVDFYLPKQRSELDWIKYAVRSINRPFTKEEFADRDSIGHGLTATTADGFRSLVLPRWVNDQAKYFTEIKVPALRKQLRSNHLYSRIFIVAGVVISVLLFLTQMACIYGYQCSQNPWFSNIQHFSIIGIAMALAIGAAIGGYTEKAAISALLKRYSWMSGIFNRAGKDLERLVDENKLGEAQDLVIELGKAALDENADWLIIRRERELEVPTG